MADETTPADSSTAAEQRIMDKNTAASANIHPGVVPSGNPATPGSVSPFSTSALRPRQTDKASSITLPVDASTDFSAIAGHLDSTFSADAKKFIAAHPGEQSFVTIAVHSGSEIVHRSDIAVPEDPAVAAAGAAQAKKLGDWMADRFPNDAKVGDGGLADQVANLIERHVPRTAASSGLAAAVGANKKVL